MIEANTDTEVNIANFKDQYQKASPAMRIWLEDAVRTKVRGYLETGEINQAQHDDAQKGIGELILEAIEGSRQ